MQITEEQITNEMIEDFLHEYYFSQTSVYDIIVGERDIEIELATEDLVWNKNRIKQKMVEVNNSGEYPIFSWME